MEQDRVFFLKYPFLSPLSSSHPLQLHLLLVCSHLPSDVRSFIVSWFLLADSRLKSGIADLLQTDEPSSHSASPHAPGVSLTQKVIPSEIMTDGECSSPCTFLGWRVPQETRPVVQDTDALSYNMLDVHCPYLSAFLNRV